MTDTDREVLDSSIIDPMPRFPSVDDFVVRERRRQRVRRSAGGLGIAAAVAGLVFGIQAGLSHPVGTPPIQPGQPRSTGTTVTVPPTSGPRTAEATAARLLPVLQARLAATLPEASVTVVPDNADTPFVGYAGFSRTLSVSTPDGAGTVVLLALWPEPGSATPTGADSLTRLFSCRGMWKAALWEDEQCEDYHRDGIGSQMVLAQETDGFPLRSIVVVHYRSDGAILMVTATNDPVAPVSTLAGSANPVLSLDQLRTLVYDGALRP